ncbi:amidohydrolase family protein [Chelativorans sp.]|uniref:amidohydrolase family protein n=1 Tax=Chelativorans sp. TaxID=2203393 RepID=UPI002811BE83|nr:amidohydrolase family protein [Chelativorans sp.]
MRDHLGEMTDGVYGNVRVPRSLVADESRFGGRLEGDCLIGDLVVRDGKVAGMAREGSAPLDLEGRILTPTLVEAHCHLDKCFTASRLDFAGGTLLDAIDAQARDKAHWTREDIRARALRGLEELWASGCRFARTHVDWAVNPTDPSHAPLAWEVLGEIAEEWRDRFTLQRAALLPIEAFAAEEIATPLAARVAQDGGVLGAFVFGQDGARESVRRMVRVARDHEISLDFHVDEDLSPTLKGLDFVAEAVASERFDGPVLCGHACSLSTIEGDQLHRRIERIAEAGLTIVCLPTSNLYLQDRGAGTPTRRGITRVQELIKRGVPLAFGTDNVRDAFCPIGAHNPFQSLAFGILAAQLEPPAGRWLPCITHAAERALGFKETMVEGCPADRLLLWHARETADLLASSPARPPQELPATLRRARRRS